MRPHKGLLYSLGGHRNRNVACCPALLKYLHVINCRIPIEIVLMPIERFCEFVEMRIARVQPTRACKAIPLTLGYHVGSGVQRGEVSGNDAVVPGQDRSNTQAAESCN